MEEVGTNRYWSLRYGYEMFLLSIIENEAIIEASLGGRVTPEEIRVFGEEIVDVLESYGPCNLLIDYSRALTMDRFCLQTLADIKDSAFAAGAVKIVSVACSDHDRVRHTSSRINEVLEGREEFVLEPREAYFAAVPMEERRAA